MYAAITAFCATVYAVILLWNLAIIPGLIVLFGAKLMWELAAAQMELDEEFEREER